MRFSAALVVAAAAAVSAQTSSDVPEYSSSLNMTIDPGSVDSNTAATWCAAEYNTCQLLCGDDTDTNDCKIADLSYECLCASNKSAPALEDYTGTMPTFICKQLFGQCIEQHANDQRAQDDCTSNIDDLCGTIDPPKEPIGSEDGGDDDDDSSPTSTTASAPTSQPTETDEAVSTSTSDGLAAPTMAPVGHGAAAAAALGMMAYLI